MFCAAGKFLKKQVKKLFLNQRFELFVQLAIYNEVRIIALRGG